MRTKFSLLCLAVLVGATACGGSDSVTSSSGGPTGQPTIPSTPAAPVLTTAVNVSDDFFDPANIQVAVGATVTWTWTTATAHNITFGDGGSGDKGAVGATFQKDFQTAGTFLYTCSLHPGMNGSVLVK